MGFWSFLSSIFEGRETAAPARREVARAPRERSSSHLPRRRTPSSAVEPEALGFRGQLGARRHTSNRHDFERLTWFFGGPTDLTAPISLRLSRLVLVLGCDCYVCSYYAPRYTNVHTPSGQSEAP